MKKETEEKQMKEDTIFVLSKFNRWVTVTPKSKNRKRPLESQRVVIKFILFQESMDQESRVMPQWMQIHVTKPENIFKSQCFVSSMTVILG